MVLDLVDLDCYLASDCNLDADFYFKFDGALVGLFRASVVSLLSPARSAPSGSVGFIVESNKMRADVVRGTRPPIELNNGRLFLAAIAEATLMLMLPLLLLILLLLMATKCAPSRQTSDPFVWPLGRCNLFDGAN